MNKKILIDLDIASKPVKPEEPDFSYSHHYDFLGVVRDFLQQNEGSSTEDPDFFNKVIDFLKEKYNNKDYDFRVAKSSINNEIFDYDFFKRENYTEKQKQKFKEDYIKQLEKYENELYLYPFNCLKSNISNLSKLKKHLVKCENDISDTVKDIMNNFSFMINGEDLYIFKNGFSHLSCKPLNLVIENYYGEFDVSIFKHALCGTDKVFKCTVYNYKNLFSKLDLIYNIFHEDFGDEFALALYAFLYSELNK